MHQKRLNLRNTSNYNPMENNTTTTTIAPPADLFDRVMFRIGMERRFISMRRKFWLSLACFVIVIFIGIPVSQAFSLDIAHSGFSDYASLIISDSSTVLGSWQDFGLSLLESLPVLSTAALLTIVLSMLIAIRSVIIYGTSAWRELPALRIAHK